MSDKIKNGIRNAALKYHSQGRKGKIEVVSTKPFITQHDLSLAYTPGVAEPCKEIEADPSKALEYTAKGNLVAVVSNGTAVLGLGDIGAIAGKPVMEGKGVLFKKFADIDVFDIELDTHDPVELVKAVKMMEPTFGGINLEDIKAPECFYIEETLKKEMKIPVFHDDQHGTAIISGAALINALEIVDKKIEDIKMVVSGAGAAGIACANFYVSLGVKKENLFMTDSKGVLWKGRGDEDKNKYKAKFFNDTEARTLGDIMRGADAFAGVSIKDILSPDMVRTMADDPIIMAMANPDPEIAYPDCIAARPDAIVATGRSDYPNQVNNVLGFPFIFRGALDVQASDINEEMKMAAAYSLAKLAKEEVPEVVKKAYGDQDLVFGREYIIPKPFDSRVLFWSAPAVAKAAMETGVAKKPIDLQSYRESLVQKVDWSRQVMRKIYNIARNNPKRIVFPEGHNHSIIWAASEIVREGVAKPILLSKSRKDTLKLFEELNHSAEGIEIIEPKQFEYKEQLVDAYYKLRQRKGITRSKAGLDMRNYFYYASMMVKEGFADAMVGGITNSYPEAFLPAVKILGPKESGSPVSGMYMLKSQNQFYFFSDCSINVNPTAEQLVDIAISSANELERLHIEPHIAMLSFSNFGSVRSPETEKIEEAVKIVKKRRPDLVIDGPMQADFALNNDLLHKAFPFAKLTQKANLLIFPNLDAGNISLKLLKSIGKNVRTIGPIVVGLSKPAHIIPRNSDTHDIINLTAIACVDAQAEEKQKDYVEDFETVLT